MADYEFNSSLFGLAEKPAKTTYGLEEPTTSVTTSSTPDSTTSSEPTSTETTTAAPAASSDTDNSSSGLSTGAKAGIGVGVSLGVIGLAALAGGFWMVRRKRAGGDRGPSGPGERQELYTEPAGYKQPEYQIQEHYGEEGLRSGSAVPPSELEGSRRPQYEMMG
ncbi:uncharacterized protein F5Z01DRAFT_109976 [Emericellopsis atlantica]|uniref:Mid2 domain-containing protein n=1 Tax=Emericellopsis atlantica TaxID=2614577 RepID=A0A9P7ZLX7_9HYPO|nr:uncharacterized protein F5Z01DRAFT_109976 [Emericellopsis atlantica]KAG9254539.1 hypothetical protein F5Z01DRAFT_109976 [Emericellopsis atlantica]